LGLTAELTHDGRVVPAFATPADAVAALAGAVAPARWREADRGELVDPSGIAPARARELLAPVLEPLGAGEVARLDEAMVDRLLECYGLALVPSRTARSEEHTSELQSRENLVCRLLLEQKNATYPAVTLSPRTPAF